MFERFVGPITIVAADSVSNAKAIASAANPRQWSAITELDRVTYTGQPGVLYQAERS